VALAQTFSRFARSRTVQDDDTETDGGELDEPPELVPGFMPTVRRALSRFLNPKKKRRVKNRRRRGLRAPLTRMAFKSKFLNLPPQPPVPKTAPPEPPPSKPPSGSSPARRRFNHPARP
jgi:hypothetical protein